VSIHKIEDHSVGPANEATPAVVPLTAPAVGAPSFALNEYFDLREYLAILVRRKFLVASMLLGVLGAAYVYHYVLNTPQYESSAKIRVFTESADDAFDPALARPRDLDRVMANEQVLAESAVVADEVEAVLGFGSSVSASANDGVDLLELRASSADARRAALIANTYADVYLRVRRELATQDYADAAEVVAEQLNDIDEQLAELAGSSETFDIQQSLSTQRQVLVGQLQTLQLNAELGQGGSAALITPAEPASSPASPKPFRDGVIALLVGLVLGGGAALVAENLDDSVRSKREVDQITGVPSLAMIPKGPSSERQVLMRGGGGGVLAEAFLSLRTSLMFLGVDGEVRVIQITSSEPAEGKSTVAVNLAYSLAQLDKKVALVDLDLRRPMVDTFLPEIASEGGFTGVVGGHCTLSEALCRHDEVNLWVLPSGNIAPNPTELLASRKAAEVLSRLRETFDYVVIDSPPVLPVADALSISQNVDAVAIVVASAQVSRTGLERCVEKLRGVNAPVVGTIYNRVDRSAGGYDYRYGEYAYGETSNGKRRFSRK
jgi:receptor protein-tyrosine kinase